SGKSLSAYLPILEGILQHQFTALSIYGLKALTADQSQKLADLLQLIPEPARPRLALLTGDTPPKTREQLLAANPSIISATPELIHYALKGVHWSQPWQHFLSRLRYIVLDEAHTFNGVYGANMASLIRRLKLAVDERGGCSQKLQFLMLSATVGNPVKLAKLLSGRSQKRNINKPERLVWINSSGAAVPERQLIVTKPTHDANSDVARIIMFLLQQGQSGICFGNGRQAIKNLWATFKQEAVTQTNSGIESQVAIFYGSLTSERRREIINSLQSGTVKCILSTSALEAGIDLPQLDFAIIRGWPGSLQAFRQRAGRAGRANSGLIVFIPIAQSPLDNYFAERPELLLSAESELVSFNANYPIDIAKHLMCAAVETGIRANKLKHYFGKSAPQIATALIEQGVLHKSRDKLWAKGFPHKDVNFRGGTGASTIQLVDAETQEEIELLSAEIAYREVFPGAIYRRQNSDGCLVTYTSRSLLNGKAILQNTPETRLFTVAISHTDTSLKQNLSLPQQIPLVIPEVEGNVQTNSTDSKAIPAQAILELVWGEISQLVTGYQLLTRNYELTCLNRKCVNYREPLSKCTTCPVCGKRTRSAELTSVLNEVNFEQPYEIKFATPVLQISLNSPVECYLQQVVTATRQELLQSQQPIPPGYQQLWEYPANLLAINSFGHQILAALPLTILASANDVNFLVEKRGANDYAGLFYDLAEGGSGTSEAIFRSLPQLAHAAAELARSCSCSSGCPKCLIQSGCPDGNKALLKQVGLLLCEAFSTP
ncbi:MAG: DEAD/DEAH box helicase, partial [Tolypothrix sp. T3-bin4]|nr:DEAD/DEAH box helicase [Tolypothrix sp. T3-bin4]